MDDSIVYEDRARARARAREVDRPSRDFAFGHDRVHRDVARYYIERAVPSSTVDVVLLSRKRDTVIAIAIAACWYQPTGGDACNTDGARTRDKCGFGGDVKNPPVQCERRLHGEQEEDERGKRNESRIKKTLDYVSPIPISTRVLLPPAGALTPDRLPATDAGAS